MPYLFDNFVLAPTTSDFPLYRWLSKLGGGNPLLPDFSNDHFSVELININVASAVPDAYQHFVLVRACTDSFPT